MNRPFLAFLLFFTGHVNADEIVLDERFSISFENAEYFSPKLLHDSKDYFRPHVFVTNFDANGNEVFYSKMIFTKIKSNRTDDDIDSDIQSSILAICSQYADTSVENKAVVKPLPESSSGYYCSVTDKTVSEGDAKGPSKYRNMSFVSIRESEYVHFAFAYSNSIDDELYRDFLRFFSSMKIIDKFKSEP